MFVRIALRMCVRALHFSPWWNSWEMCHFPLWLLRFLIVSLNNCFVNFTIVLVSVWLSVLQCIYSLPILACTHFLISSPSLNVFIIIQMVHVISSFRCFFYRPLSCGERRYRDQSKLYFLASFFTKKPYQKQ